MSDDVLIRDGKIKDKFQVVHIWQEMMDYHRKISTIDFDMIDEAPELFMRFFERHVRSKIRKAVVAEKDDEIVGYLIGDIQKRPPVMKTKYFANIYDIAVKIDLRKKGIGSKLLESFNNWAMKKGVAYISLLVVPENAMGLKFYDKHDFRTVLLSKRKMI